MTNLTPRILFCCPGSVLDTTSGAAKSALTLLKELAGRGFSVAALQATIYDAPTGGVKINSLLSQNNKPIVRAMINGVEHLFLKTKSNYRQLMNSQEQEIFLDLLRREIQIRKPQIILLWGNLLLERYVMQLAKEHDISVIFYLVNAGYKDATLFKNVAAVITDTNATANLYKVRHNLDCVVIGKLIDKKEISALSFSPKYLTFVNPTLAKGVSLFIALARKALQDFPEVEFLVVESRGSWAKALIDYELKPDDLPNVTVYDHQPDMRQIFGLTKCLLLPSLWHESGSRLIVESHINGIPVIASDTGGSKEFVGLGGLVLPVPKKLQENFSEKFIDQDELRPWLDAIQKIWFDDQYCAELKKLAMQEGDKFNLDESVDRFITLIKKLTKK